MSSLTTGRVLHVAPHPDDEVLGAGATLTLLRSNGWSVENLVCTLGRHAEHGRRRRELLEAAERAGFGTTIMDPLAELSSTSDLGLGAASVAKAVLESIDASGASLVVSPHPHDGHHAHEAVGRAVRDAVSQREGVTWWMWGLWGDLPLPTLLVPFGEDTMLAVQHAIAAYRGENARNGFDALYPARAVASAVLGSERVFGFGAHRASALPYAELLSEAVFVGQKWRLGHPRILDPASPLRPWDGGGIEATDLLTQVSPRTAMLRQ